MHPQGGKAEYFGWPGSTRNVKCGWYCYHGHDAIDIFSWYGAPIYAADSGVVTKAGWMSGGGNTIRINHGNGFETVYMHASSLAVSAGQSVQRGQLIGYEGATGYAFGPHLHFEIHYNGRSVNPMLYL